MKVETNWGCECQRYFVPTEKLNGKGNRITIPVEVRKLHLRGRFFVSGITDRMVVTMLRRRAGNIYCVKYRKAPERWWHDTSPIKESDYKWVKEGTYNRVEFIKWLKFWVPDPIAVVVELETCPPDTATKLAA